MDKDQLFKKRNIYLAIFISLTILFFAAIVLVAIFVKDYQLMTLINILISVVLILVLIKFRESLYSLNTLCRIAKLETSQGPILTYKHNPFDRISYLIDDGYKVTVKNQRYTILYKVSLEKDLHRKHKTFSVVIFIEDNTMDFYDKFIHDDIAGIEETLIKEKLNPKFYQIIAYRLMDQVSKEVIDQIAEVVNYRIKANTYTQVNVGVDVANKKAYFLYSNTYSPSTNYSDVVKNIHNMIGVDQE